VIRTITGLRTIDDFGHNTSEKNTTMISQARYFRISLFVLAIAGAPLASAQKWEVGVGIGGSFYTSQTFTSAVAKADASLTNGIAASVWLGNNSGNLLGGELRYDYENTNLKLSSGNSSASFGAQTNAFHYDFLLHLAPRSSPIRPFVAAGGGVKVYRGTGAEQPFQPLSNLGLLTKTGDVKGLISVGAGIKFNVGRVLQFRVEVHDYMTPFPNKVIAPVEGVKAGGWLQDFVPMGALALTF
jgi:hypothetical protein